MLLKRVSIVLLRYGRNGLTAHILRRDVPQDLLEFILMGFE